MFASFGAGLEFEVFVHEQNKAVLIMACRRFSTGGHVIFKVLFLSNYGKLSPGMNFCGMAQLMTRCFSGRALLLSDMH